MTVREFQAARLRRNAYLLFAMSTWLGSVGGVAAQTVEYYHLDALGSVRAISNQAGSVIQRYDYLPFGEEANPTVTANTRKFTGKERDTETGLDYVGARYYSSRTARFTTVDPVYTWRENLADPQRWNRYAYARNNPLRYTDPDGREITYASPQLRTFFAFLAARSEAVRATLALYEGPNNPNLTISQAALGKDSDGPLGGLFTPQFDYTTDLPPGSGNFDRLAGMSPAEIQTGLANGSLLTSATLKGATLQLDASLSLSVTSLGRSKQEQQMIGVALHELGHADLAARNPLTFYRLASPLNQMERGRRQPHERRQIEREANQYRDRNLRSFPQ